MQAVEADTPQARLAILLLKTEDVICLVGATVAAVLL